MTNSDSLTRSLTAEGRVASTALIAGVCGGLMGDAGARGIIGALLLALNDIGIESSPQVVCTMGHRPRVGVHARVGRTITVLVGVQGVRNTRPGRVEELRGTCWGF